MNTIGKIKTSITIPTLWQKLYGEAPVMRGAKRLALCPFHEEKTPSLSIFAKDERFHCFGCGVRGDVIDFFRLVKGLPETRDGNSAAIRSLAQMLNIRGESAPYEHLKPEIRRSVARIETCSRHATGQLPLDITPEYFEWARGKGISDSVVIKMVREGSLTFEGGKPNYHYNTGIKVRFDVNSSKSSRWMKGSPQGGLWRFKVVRDFSIHTLFLCEGESDTMRVLTELAKDPEAGGIDVAGIPQSSFDPAPALAALIGSGRDVVLCFDNDKAGRVAMDRIGDALHTHANECRIFHFPWQEGDPKDVCALGERIANKLAHIKKVALMSPS